MLIIIKLTNSLISSEVTLLMFKQNIKLPLECFPIMSSNHFVVILCLLCAQME